MTRVVRTSAVAVTVAAAGIGVSPSASAIVGGSPTTRSSVVQYDSDQGSCSANVVNSRWVLTAKHCIEGAHWVNIYLANSYVRPGKAYAADHWYASPSGDFALIHLKQAISAPSARLAWNYVPKSGQSGTIYGFGLHANNSPATVLYKASVNVIGSSTDAYGGSAVHIRGVNGIDNHGDSGGPLIVNGYVVGVDSDGDTEPVTSIRATSNYANITTSRMWIWRMTHS